MFLTQVLLHRALPLAIYNATALNINSGGTPLVRNKLPKNFFALFSRGKLADRGLSKGRIFLHRSCRATFRTSEFLCRNRAFWSKPYRLTRLLIIILIIGRGRVFFNNLLIRRRTVRWQRQSNASMFWRRRVAVALNSAAARIRACLLRWAVVSDAAAVRRRCRINFERRIRRCCGTVLVDGMRCECFFLFKATATLITRQRRTPRRRRLGRRWDIRSCVTRRRVQVMSLQVNLQRAVLSGRVFTVRTLVRLLTWSVQQLNMKHNVSYVTCSIATFQDDVGQLNSRLTTRHRKWAKRQNTGQRNRAWISDGVTCAVTVYLTCARLTYWAAGDNFNNGWQCKQLWKKHTHKLSFSHLKNNHVNGPHIHVVYVARSLHCSGTIFTISWLSFEKQW